MKQFGLGLGGAVAVGALWILPSMANAAAVRVDVNGELVNTDESNGFPISSPPPRSWTPYATNDGGGIAYRYDAGGASNTFSAYFEDEEAGRAVDAPSTAGVYPGGHSILFGGSGASTQLNTYGIAQTINSTAGKVYWLSGAQGASADWSTAQQARYTFDYGLQNGTGTDKGLLSSGNIRRSGGGLQNARFTHAIVADGSGQVTAHVGLQSKAVSTADINVYADGFRVYELDVPVYATITNGTFEDPNVQDISQYNAKGTTIIYEQQDLLPGWTPLGGGTGQRTNYNSDTAVKSEGTASFQFVQNKGIGRMYAMQRVKSGDAGGSYTLTGDIRNDTAESNGLIGIDPTGGLNPTAASVQWLSTTVAADSAFHTVTLQSVTDTVGNGVTIFLAAGYTSPNIRSAGDSGARFDNVQLSYAAAPEPGALMLLTLGGLLAARRRRR